MVKAVRQTDCACNGNRSKSLWAALIQEIGRVFLVIGILLDSLKECSHI
jgi:hypothetical protein